MLRGERGMLIQIQPPPEPPEILPIFWLLAPRKQETQAGSQRGPLSLRQWLRWVIGGWPAPQSSRGTGETVGAACRASPPPAGLHRAPLTVGKLQGVEHSGQRHLAAG